MKKSSNYNYVRQANEYRGDRQGFDPLDQSNMPWDSKSNDPHHCEPEKPDRHQGDHELNAPRRKRRVGFANRYLELDPCGWRQDAILSHRTAKANIPKPNPRKHRSPLIRSANENMTM
jgi:hypothetical protein